MKEQSLICEYSGLPSLSSYNIKKIEMENVNSVAYVAKIDEIKEYQKMYEARYSNVKFFI